MLISTAFMQASLLMHILEFVLCLQNQHSYNRFFFFEFVILLDIETPCLWLRRMILNTKHSHFEKWTFHSTWDKFTWYPLSVNQFLFRASNINEYIRSDLYNLSDLLFTSFCYIQWNHLQHFLYAFSILHTLSQWI